MSLTRQKPGLPSNQAGRTAHGLETAHVRAPGPTPWFDVVEQTVSGLGYDLVDAERAAHGLLRVYIDCAVGSTRQFVTVEDCEIVTRQLQHVLEVEGCAYERLEVSSPGLDRPLRRPQDFERFIGYEVALQLKEPFEGRKNFTGTLGSSIPGAQADAAAPLQSCAEQTWELVFQKGKASHVLSFALHELREARLVPVVDFKGRRFAATSAESNITGKEDGDRDE